MQRIHVGFELLTQRAHFGPELRPERFVVGAQTGGLVPEVDGGVLEILVSPKGGWTMLVTYPKRPTCVIAVGEAWQMLQLAGEPA